MTLSKTDPKDWHISVLGDGGWGTTLALYLRRLGYPCMLWGAFPDYVDFVKKKRENVKFLPGVAIPPDLEITADLAQALKDARIVVVAIPSQYVRDVCKRITSQGGKGRIWVSVAKGIEKESLCRMSEVIRQEIAAESLCVLSGPSHCEEVARSIPTTAVVACDKPALAEVVQRIFHSEVFRLYTTRDVIGVEVGGSLKNVIAIAVGISDGLGFGDNTKAALMTRGLAEITRLGVAMGAKAETFAGLSGMGDLVVTCISRHSRNRNFGQMIGQGMDVQAALKQTQMVVEGVHTAVSAHALGKKFTVDTPIVDEVYSVLYEAKNPRTAVRDLLARDPRPESETERKECQHGIQ